MSHVGITHLDVTSWAQDFANHKVAKFMKVEFKCFVYLQVQKLCVSLLDDFGNPLPLESILPTLLHEFAHCVTKGEMVQGHNEKGK